MKKIEKICITDEEIIEIKLEDVRDVYNDEYSDPEALGVIGSIYISREGLTIYPHFDPDDKIQALRYKKLLSAFNEIFKSTDYNPLSSKYYNEIKTMIEDGTLKSLGYKITKMEEELEEPFEWFNRKHNRNH